MDRFSHPVLRNYDTYLTPEEERQFLIWKAQNAPNDSGEDYDLRGAFKASLQPDAITGHWTDRFKKPNHPTFSNQSQYANFGFPGSWQGEEFIPNPRYNLNPPEISLQRPSFPSINFPLQTPTPPNVYSRNYPAPIPINPAQRLLPEENIPVPQYENYRPSRGRTVLNAIAGGLAGASGGPLAGLTVGERLRDNEYNKALEDYQYKTFDRKRRLAEEEERFKRGKEETELGVKHEQNEALNTIKDEQNRIKDEMAKIAQQRANTQAVNTASQVDLRKAQADFLTYKQRYPEENRLFSAIMNDFPPGPERDAVLKEYEKFKQAGSQDEWQFRGETDKEGNVRFYRTNAAKGIVDQPINLGPVGKPSAEPGQYFQVFDTLGNRIGYENPKTETVKTSQFEGGRSAGLPQLAIEKRALLQDVSEDATDLARLATKLSSKFGKISGNVTDFINQYVGSDDPDTVRLARLMRKLLITRQRIESGQQVSDQETKRLATFMPALDTPFSTAIVNIQEVAKESQRMLKLITGKSTWNPNAEKPKLKGSEPAPRTTPSGRKYEVLR